MFKKRILFLFNKFPYPVIGGDRIKVYNLGKILSKYFSLDLVCINEGASGIYRLSKEPFENIVCFNYPSIKFKLNAFLGIPSSLPLQTHYYYFPQVQKFIDDNLKHYDLVFCHLLRMALYVINKKIPKIIDLADSLALTYQRFYPYAHNMWRLLYKIDATRLARYELEIIRQFDKVLLVNKKEKELLVSGGAQEEKIKIITNGVDTNLLLRERTGDENKELVFFGRLAAFQNEDAVIYFAKEIWPLIRKQRKDIKFVIIGADPTYKILHLKKIAGIEVCGYLEDPYERILKSMLCVFPMRVAAGVQNKILETMALGKTIVTTPIAAEAIKGQDGKHFIIGYDKLDIRNKILELLDNRGLREEIGTNARQLIKTQYSWSNYKEKLMPEIERLLF